MFKRVIILIFLIFLSLSCENTQIYSVKEEFKDFYFKNGSNIASDAFLHLSGNLKKEVEKSNFADAISFCSLNGESILKQSQSNDYIEIKRVSDRNRNPNNLANNQELEIIENYKKALNKNGNSNPILIATKHDVIFYSPIKMMPFCLNCHGDRNKEIAENTKNKLKELYPDDKAVSYKANDLRGLWKIVFKNQEKNIKVSN